LSKGSSASGVLQIKNIGGGTLLWNFSRDPEKNWINLNPVSGINSGNINVTVNTEGLAPGEYTGNITIKSNVGTKQGTIYLNVTPIKPPILKVEPDPLLFNFILSETKSASKEFQISNIGGGVLEWKLLTDSDWPTWISFSQTSGTNSGYVTITVNAEALDLEEYKKSFTVWSNGGTKQGTIYINISQEDKPILAVYPSSLNFDLNKGESTSQELHISKEGNGTLKWNASPDPASNWISLDPMNGTDTGNVTVKVNAEDLDKGEYDGNIAIESNGQANSEYIPVKLVVSDLTPPPMMGPDLIVTSLKIGDLSERKILYDNGSVRKYIISAPVSVVVKNQGDVAAGIFATSIKSNYLSESYDYVAFKGAYAAYTNAPLGPGEESNIEGNIEFVYHPEYGNTFYIKAIADDCTWSSSCINESNEDNNESQPVEVNIPDFEENNRPVVEETTIAEQNDKGTNEGTITHVEEVTPEQEVTPVQEVIPVQEVTQVEVMPISPSDETIVN
jgi:hypothetical protein